MLNPIVSRYKVGAPVRGADFYGRADILARTRTALEHTQIILIQSQRRIGKTSFLHALRDFLIEMKNSSDGFQPVVFDIQAYVGDTLPQFLEHLAQAIGKEVAIPIPTSDELRDDAFLFQDTWLPEVLDRLGSLRLVLLVDEFDNLSEEAGGPAIRELIRFIRNLMERETRLKWVLTIGRQIGKLPIQYDAIVSQALKLPLGRFSRQDTERLVVELAAGMLTYRPEAIERIYALASGHPMLTQALGTNIVLRVAYDDGRSTVTADDVDAILDQALDMYEGAIASITRVPLLEERVLAAVARLASHVQAPNRSEIGECLVANNIELQVDELSDALSRLVEWDLLVREDDRFHLAVEIIRIWIVRHIPLFPSQTDTIDLLQARAQSRREVAEKALRIGQTTIAIEEFIEALKHVPMDAEALRGLAEAYRLTNNISERAQTLQKLYRVDRSVQAQLIEAIDEYADDCLKKDNVTEAAEQYDTLLRLRDSRHWRQALARARVQQARQYLESNGNLDRGHLFNARWCNDQRAALANLQQKMNQMRELEIQEPEISWVGEAAGELARQDQILAISAQAYGLAVEKKWKEAGHELFALKEAGVVLAEWEERLLKEAALQQLVDRNSVFYSVFPSLVQGRWPKPLAALLGLSASILIIVAAPYIAPFGGAILGVLVTLSVGIVRSLGSRNSRRIWGVHIAAACMAAFIGLFMSFPPKTNLDVFSVFLFVSVILVVAKVGSLGANLAEIVKIFFQRAIRMRYIVMPDRSRPALPEVEIISKGIVNLPI